MENKCKMFNRERYMEEYDAHIELNSTLTRNIIAPNGKYIYSSWTDNENYDITFCLPAVTVTSGDC